jgi:hypothetical protein
MFVTIAKRPFVLGRDTRDQQVICLKRQWKYFCEGGWTGKRPICPSGNIIGSFQACAKRRILRCAIAHRGMTIVVLKPAQRISEA